MSITKKLAFIVCNNGFGHFTRTTRVITRLLQSKHDIRVSLFCSNKHFKAKSNDPIVQHLVTNKNVTVVDTNKNISWDNLEPKSDIPFKDTIYKHKDITSADLVISDNLSQVLEYRSDAILLGSFLWSEIYNYHYPNNYFASVFHDREMDLLSKCKPTMICLRDFAMKYVLELTSPFKTNIVLDEKINRQNSKEARTILISPGGTDTTLTLTKEISSTLLSQGISVYVPGRLSHYYSDKTKEFDYSQESFKNIDLIIARAGIGTITDAVKYNIPIICIGGDDNYEIQNNSTKVEKLNFGFNAGNSVTKIKEHITTLEQSDSYNKYYQALDSTLTNGMEQIIEHIASRLA